MKEPLRLKLKLLYWRLTGRKVIYNPGHDSLHQWFSLSYASFAVLPRVLMNQMPDKWQGQMAELLSEFDATFENLPPEAYSFTLRSVVKGKMVPMPEWLKNYKHPDYNAIEECKTKVQK